MAIELRFRGPCLFVVEQNRIHSVALPHAAPGVIPREGTAGKHLDGSPAHPHHPGLLILDVKGKERHRVEPLRGSVVVRDGQAHKPPVAKFTDVVGLDRVNNNGSATDLRLVSFDDFDHVAATIVFRGGKLEGHRISSHRWTVNDRFNPTHPHKDSPLVLTQTWTTNQAAVNIDIVDLGGGTIPLVLADGEVAYLYNFDVEFPSQEQLDADEACTVGTPLDDVDFNWLYQLVEPRTGTLAERMGGGELPRPRSTCTAVMTPTTSTCFGGSWGP